MAGALALGLPLLMAAGLMVLAIVAPEQFEDEKGLLFNLLVGIAAGGEGVGFLMLFWLCPWYESGNARSRWIWTPRSLQWRLVLLIWTPCAATAFFALLWLAIVPWVNSTYANNPDLTAPQAAGYLLLVLFVPMAVWCYWLTRRVRQRVLTSTRVRQVCFACGYDLRGNPAGPCPECGHTTT